jgi:hypothetical protein
LDIIAYLNYYPWTNRARILIGGTYLGLSTL